MLMNIAKAVNLIYDPFQFLKIHSPANGPDRLRIGRLHPDLQLNQSRTHGFHQCKFLFPQKIC